MAIEIQQISKVDARHKWVTAWGIGLRGVNGAEWPWLASGPFMVVLAMRAKQLHIVKAELKASVYTQAFAHVLAKAMIEQERALQLGCKCSMPPSQVLHFNPTT